jgi:CheY-like chemotaxis protein
MKTTSTHTILYVDDDSDDLQMLREAISSVDRAYRFVAANDGEEGLNRLEDMKEAGSLPCLIVLDINMPRLDGRQTFRLIRSDEALARIPIVIFSTSDSSLDKLFFRGENVAYITKPVDFNHLQEIARKMLQICNN